ncbi:uncharacterized protein JCM6883_003042 [Sporobolomyces salmoneus]|uniref:uncharacterized protein n=1 Tax=Sporobolomyces salmoneus TaxID=183962 RepID=UPI003181EE1F
MLTNEEIETIRSKYGAKEPISLSRTLGSKLWKLELCSVDDNDINMLELELHVVPHMADLRLATSAERWAREGSWSWEISLVLPPQPSIVLQRKSFKISKAEFNDSAPGWGKPLISVRDLLFIFSVTKSVGIRCCLSADQSVQLSPTPPNPFIHFLDNPTCCDTLFAIHCSSERVLHVLASRSLLVSVSSYFKTLFESSFAESSARQKITLGSLKIYRKYASLSFATTKKELFPFTTIASPSASSSESEDDGAASPFPGPYSAVTTVPERYFEADDSGKFFVIDIHETDFFAYRSMIAYLHTKYTPLLHLPSDALVEYHQGAGAGARADRRTPESYLALWLVDEFHNSKKHPLYTGVHSCSAHAMYRLADRYELDELKEMSLGFIVRSLTVENVAYELFSSLSLDYEPVQKPVFNFLCQNWDAVKSTKAFEIVFERFSLGELSTGKDLMASIFKMTPSASDPKKRKRQA